VAGILYLVSTPIGNLRDFTYRAVEILGASDLILAEDTRRTRVLLDHYRIETRRLKSFHQHNEAARTDEICKRLAANETVALVSDAGTPLVSDPGLRLVRAALEAGAQVSPVPGASATLAALVASGLDPQPFTFFGFLPRSGRDRRDVIAQLESLGHTAILFESPQRLPDTLEELAVELGKERRVVVARELTKVHEEYRRGTLDDTAAYYRQHPPRGEVVVCLAGVSAANLEDVWEEARSLARSMVEEGATSKDIVGALGARFGIERNRAYAIALELAEGRSE
jgi:16S rRNA (cytidine1402-2'-O)-methyltransferase